MVAVHPKLQEKAQDAQDDIQSFAVNHEGHENHEKLLAASAAIADLAEGKSPSKEDAKELIDLVPITDHNANLKRGETKQAEEEVTGLGVGSSADVRDLSQRIREKNIEIEELSPLENLKETSRSFIARQASDKEDREISINLAEKAFNSIDEVKELAEKSPGFEKSVEAMESMSKGNAPTLDQAKAIEKVFNTMDIEKDEKSGEIEVGEFPKVPASVRNLVETSRMQIKISVAEGEKAKNAEVLGR